MLRLDGSKRQPCSLDMDLSLILVSPFPGHGLFYKGSASVSPWSLTSSFLSMEFWCWLSFPWRSGWELYLWPLFYLLGQHTSLLLPAPGSCLMCLHVRFFPEINSLYLHFWHMASSQVSFCKALWKRAYKERKILGLVILLENIPTGVKPDLFRKWAL